MDEEVELLIDGTPCRPEAVPPELKAQVEKGLAAARAASEKAGAGKVKLRINIKRAQAAGDVSSAPIVPGAAFPGIGRPFRFGAGALWVLLLGLLAAGLALLSRLGAR